MLVAPAPYGPGPDFAAGGEVRSIALPQVESITEFISEIVDAELVEENSA